MKISKNLNSSKTTLEGFLKKDFNDEKNRDTLFSYLLNNAELKGLGVKELKDIVEH